MQKLIMLAALFCGLGWGAWPNGYAYRATFVVNHLKVPSNQTAATVSIFGTYSNLIGKITDASTCNDFILTDSASTLLPFEKAGCDPASGIISYFTKMDLSSTVDVTFYAYYGKSGDTDHQDVTTTWSNGYVYVAHLSNGVTLSLADSSASAATFTNTNTVTATSAQIDGGAATNGSSNYLQYTGTISDGTASSTIEAWAYAGSTSAGVHNIFARGVTIGSGVTYGQQLRRNGSAWEFYTHIGGGGADCGAVYAAGVTATTWTYVVGVHDITVPGVVVFTNGVQRTSQACAGSGLQDRAGTNYAWGADIVDGAATSYWNGSLDELRISTVARTANWLATQYNNTGDYNNFWTSITWDAVSGASSTRRFIAE